MSTQESPTTAPTAERSGADAVAHAVEATLERLEARRREEAAAEKERGHSKERLTNRVSVAAISLTMLMSFLNFARAERDGARAAASGDAARARSDAEANWAYYQGKIAERDNYVVADDALARQEITLTAGDPRVRLAEVQNADYAERIAAIDHETAQIFFLLQDLERRQILRERDAARIGRNIASYDIGTRILTLAVVLLSVTLLANKRFLFWVSIAIALVGAAVAVNGYFLFF